MFYIHQKLIKYFCPHAAWTSTSPLRPSLWHGDNADCRFTPQSSAVVVHLLSLIIRWKNTRLLAGEGLLMVWTPDTGNMMTWWALHLPTRLWLVLRKTKKLWRQFSWWPNCKITSRDAPGPKQPYSRKLTWKNHLWECLISVHNLIHSIQ